MSELFVWTDDLCVGLEELDEQHRMLAGILNELYVAVHARCEREACLDLIDRLVENTRIHFKVEESLMRLLDYPDLAAHKEQHATLIRQVTIVQDKLRNGGAPVSFELLHLLKVWLVAHIGERDKSFGNFAIASVERAPGVSPIRAVTAQRGRRRSSG
jgi:hemerythrin